MVVPVDEHCPLTHYKVYIDPTGLAYDVSLNQTNAGNNNNKYYRIQLLSDGSGTDFKTWTRWGRVGERGQSALLGGGGYDDALKQFNKKFKDKSSLAFASRNDPPKLGKYTFIERSYDDDSDDEGEDSASGSGVKDEDEDEEDDWVEPVSQLSLPLQNLMGLIFNTQIMNATMADLNYDVNKMPLGKLSKSTISKGFQALKDLGAILNDQSLAATLHGGHTYAQVVEMLSNQFYSLIPHDFGRNRPPIINSEGLLKREVELMESLGDMKEAAAIMKASIPRDPVHKLDRHFAALNMHEMTPLGHDTAEFAEIATYLTGTKTKTHSVGKYQVEEVFRIQRDGEFERFDNSEYATIPSDRRLLWHGSRSTNYGGILSQGLRIAPPEAPVSGSVEYNLSRVAAANSFPATCSARACTSPTRRPRVPTTAGPTSRAASRCSFSARPSSARRCSGSRTRRTRPARRPRRPACTRRWAWDRRVQPFGRTRGAFTRALLVSRW